MVKKGETVNPDTTLLRANYRAGRLCIINVARDFNIPPGNTGKYVLKKEGDHVKWLETIAKRTTFEAMKQIESPVDGVVERIDSILGVIIIREIIERPDVPIILDVKKELNDSIKNFNEYIVKKEGDRVEYGQAVAGIRIMSYMPFYRKKVISPCAGTIIKIDYTNGKIFIQKDMPKTEMKAHYWGQIKKIIPQYGAEIEFAGYILECAFGTGNITWGRFVDTAAEREANIIFSEYLSSKDMSSIIEQRPGGIIAGSVDYEGVELLEKHHITSIIIEGFGRLPINKNHRSLLEQCIGRNIILKASTQVRAGVIRPEIVVPSDEEFYKCMTIKDQFKIVWGKHYGKQGVLKGSPHFDEISSGTKTWLCDVLCDDNEEITVPYNNLQVLE